MMPHILTPIMSEYPLVLDLVLDSKELLFSDWEQTEEVLLKFPLTDEQITAIQERKSLDVPNWYANVLSKDKDFVIIDCEKGGILLFDNEASQLTLGNLLEPAHEDWYTILLTLPITADQLQIVQDACERAVIYEATHDENDNLIIPQVEQPEIAYA